MIAGITKTDVLNHSDGLKEVFSRKGATAQRKRKETRQRFAPLREKTSLRKQNLRTY